SEDPAGETIAFELIVPALLAEAEHLGIFTCKAQGLVHRWLRQREAKLAALPRQIINRNYSPAHSCEMVGKDNLQVLDTDNLLSANGSVGSSPAATAFFLLNIEKNNAPALSFLRDANVEGGVPNVLPIDIFEVGWSLADLSLLKNLDTNL